MSYGCLSPISHRRRHYISVDSTLTLLWGRKTGCSRRSARPVSNHRPSSCSPTTAAATMSRAPSATSRHLLLRPEIRLKLLYHRAVMLCVHTYVSPSNCAERDCRPTGDRCRLIAAHCVYGRWRFARRPYVPMERPAAQSEAVSRRYRALIGARMMGTMPSASAADAAAVPPRCGSAS